MTLFRRYLAYAGIAAFLLVIARGFHERDVLGVFADLRQTTIEGTLSFLRGYALMLLAVVFACELVPALLKGKKRD